MEAYRDWPLTPDKGWGLVRLNATRDEVVRWLEENGVEFEDDEADPQWMIVPGLCCELQFTDDEPATLWQIELIGDDIPARYRAYLRRGRGGSLLRKGATACFIAAVDFIAWRSFRNEQRWREAPTVTGRVVEVIEYDEAEMRPVFVVEYADLKQQQQRVRWTLRDLYVSPGVGDEVEVTLRPDLPNQPMGPAAVRNTGFLDYVPYLLIAMLVYCVVLAVDAMLGRGRAVRAERLG